MSRAKRPKRVEMNARDAILQAWFDDETEPRHVCSDRDIAFILNCQNKDIPLNASYIWYFRQERAIPNKWDRLLGLLGVADKEAK